MQYGSLREKIAAEKAERAARYEKFHAIVAEAFAAGDAAGQAAAPTPMIVSEAGGGKSWHVAEGACGFAWVKFRGAVSNTSFGKYIAKHKIASPAYPSGLQIWISAFNQSLDRKEACARAMAEVFNRHGIDCYAGSRMD